MHVQRNLRNGSCLEELGHNREESVNCIHIICFMDMEFGKSSVISLTEFSKELKVLHDETMSVTIPTALLPCGPWSNVS